MSFPMIPTQRRRRTRTGRFLTTITTLALSSGFSPSIPSSTSLPPRGSRIQSSNSRSTVSSSALHVLTSPDHVDDGLHNQQRRILLKKQKKQRVTSTSDKISGEDNSNAAELERLYQLSSNDVESNNEELALSGRPPSISSSSSSSSQQSVKQKSTAPQRKMPAPVFRRISKAPVKDIGKGDKSRRYSRPSTMPGIAGRSRARRRSPSIDQDGVKGQAMYKKAAVVPDSLVDFADEIHKQERITRQQEIELGELTQEAVRLQNLYESLHSRLEREPTDEEWCAEAGKINMEAIRQAMEDGLAAKNKLVTSNLRMVQSVVNTYIRNGLSAQYNAGDMMQEGILALIRAAEKFEPDRGWKFSTYAMYWVRASVKRSQVSQSRIMGIPQRHHETHKRLRRIEAEIVAQTGTQPTPAQLGETIGLSAMQVERCFTAMEQRMYSLDQQLRGAKDDGSRKDTLNDIVAEGRGDSDAVWSEVFLRQDLINALYRHLTPQEAELLLLRYGLKDAAALTSTRVGRNPTIAELSRLVGLKPDKVRRIIHKSLKRLQTNGAEEFEALEQQLSTF